MKRPARRDPTIIKNILLIEEQGSVTAEWHGELAHRGFRVQSTNWDRSLVKARHMRPDIIVVDVARPAASCLSHCRELREIGHAPVILLTDHRSGLRNEKGLSILTKPLEFDRFCRRIEDILAAQAPSINEAERYLQVGEITLDKVEHAVIKNGQRQVLTPKLFALLLEFMRHRGRILSCKELLKTVWGTEWMGDVRTLYVHIHWLRQCIEEDPDRPVYLRTVRGLGYRFDAPD